MENNPKIPKIEDNDGLSNPETETELENEKEKKKEKEEMGKVMDLIKTQLAACPNEQLAAQLAGQIRQKLKDLCNQIESQDEINKEILQVLVQPSPAPAVQTALQNDVIIRLVFTHLDSASLLSNRLVCKLWEDASTGQLLTRRHENKFKIRFEWCEETQKYEHRNWKSLQDFHDTCDQNNSRARVSEKARQFLCSQTKLVFKGGDLKTTLDYFFHDLGVFVRFLSLKPRGSHTEEFKSTLQSILMDSTPNLETLTFKSPGVCTTNLLEKPQDKNGLEKLRVLKLTHFEKESDQLMQQLFVATIVRIHGLRGLLERRGLVPDDSTNPLLSHQRKIMEFAPNLQSIQDPELIHTLQIVAAGKFHLVKSLDLKFPPDHSNFLVAFAKFGPKLTRLNLIKKREDRRTPKLGDVAALILILQTSQSTLEEFEGVENLRSIFPIQFPVPILTPVFPLVKKLRLASPPFCSSEGRILPMGLDFAVLFPNLASLQFDQLFEDALHFETEAGNGSDSLQHLQFEVKGDFNPSWLDKISRLYPNLNSLHVKIKISNPFSLSLFPLVCKSIWTSLTQLTSLHLILEATRTNPQGNGTEVEKENENKGKNDTDETDSVFTGFSLDFCRKLKGEDSVITRSDPVLLDKLREFPSIFDMKKLTELKISCIKIHPGKLWSRVTEIHGFEKMKQQQNLRIEITQRI